MTFTELESELCEEPRVATLEVLGGELGLDLLLRRPPLFAVLEVVHGHNLLLVNVDVQGVPFRDAYSFTSVRVCQYRCVMRDAGGCAALAKGG